MVPGRRAIQLGLSLAVLCLGACGAGTTSGSPTSAPPVSPSTASQTTSSANPSSPAPSNSSTPPECQATQLQGVMLTLDSALGTATGGFELRNTATTACMLRGYLGVQITNASGQQLALTYAPASFGEQSTVVLQPDTAPLNSGNDRGHAVFYMQWGDNCDGNSSNSPANWVFTPPHLGDSFAVPARAVAKDVQGLRAIICANKVEVGPLSPPGTSPPA